MTQKKQKTTRHQLFTWLERRLFAILIFLAIFISSTTTVSAQSSMQEKIDKIKTAYLINFIKFSTWKNPQQADTALALQLTIIGDRTYKKAIEQAFPNGKLSKRNITINYIFSDEIQYNTQTMAILKKSHLVYVRNGTDQAAQTIFSQCKPLPFLLLGDTLSFSKNGGHIGFHVIKSKVAFAVNVNAIYQAKVRLSSKVMRIGIQVKTEE